MHMGVCADKALMLCGVVLGENVRPFEPPLPSAICWGTVPQTSPPPPAPGAYAPLRGAGCGAPPKPWWLLAMSDAREERCIGLFFQNTFSET